MPVYMNSGKIVAGRVDGKSKVLQEVLADLKRLNRGGAFVIFSLQNDLRLLANNQASISD